MVFYFIFASFDLNKNEKVVFVLNFILANFAQNKNENN
jgi:hypothetical protein